MAETARGLGSLVHMKRYGDFFARLVSFKNLQQKRRRDVDVITVQRIFESLEFLVGPSSGSGFSLVDL
jgi:hypothetical protein